MNKEVLDHYLQFGLFTNPGLYKDLLKELPDDIREIGSLVRDSIIHQVSLQHFEVASNEELEQGDRKKLPWYRQPEDAILATTSAILAELYRRDSKGFTHDRAVKDKLVLTCRPVSILIASILKSKGIAARVRSGFAPYLPGYEGKSADHWINQYWDKDKNKWIAIDVDGSTVIKGFDPYDIPEGKFDHSADAWLDARSGKVNPHHFYNARPETGLIVIAWELFYDFHCLMNSEIIYMHHPEPSLSEIFPTLNEGQLIQIDGLATLMQEPDKNFAQLKNIWETNPKFRKLKGALLYGT